MKKTIYIIALCLFALFSTTLLAQGDPYQENGSQSEAYSDDAQDGATQDTLVEEQGADAEEEESRTFHQVIKEQFIAGDWRYMSIVLLCLILGLSIAIERIFILHLSTTNTTKLLMRVEKAIAHGALDQAKKICSNTPGPAASIFMQGLMRINEGIDMIEKSILSYGSVEMAKLERGMVWINVK